jgi:hypothetical protein
MTEKQRYYKTDDGKQVPLFEADHDMAFKVYKTDRRKSVIGDPKHCIEAKGLCRLPNVREAYIGSGKDAYVIFEKAPRRPFSHAIHFMIPIASGRVRDAFDTKRDLKSQILMLKAPASGQTRAHRSLLNKRRRDAIKNGAPVKKRATKAAATRVQRLGIDHRPRAKITAGVVSIPAEAS